MDLTTNAVTEYRRLREQGVKPSDAVEHARLRFGISADVLKRRVNGLVADSEATQEALAEARQILTEPHDNDDHPAVLRRLYEAVTGESI